MTRRIAHRGYAGEHPENTLRAVRRAAAASDVVEVDVRRCGSGELVCMHDETVDRVTEVAGPVSAFSRAELDALSVLGSGEGVPALPDILDAVPPDTGVNAELKEARIAADALSVLREHPHETIVSSFRDGVLEAAREARQGSEDVALASLHDVSGGIDGAVDAGCELVHPHYDLCDAAYVERAHDAGLAVNAWTVTNPAVARRLAATGVDGIIADYASVFDAV
jgi:glycerophosphoryl diester phosphodiesterase